MLKHKIKKEEGSGLVLTLMVLLVLSVLGASVATVTMGSNRLGHATQDSNSAYYIAEAGVNMAYEEIENYVMEAYDTSDSQDLFFGKMTKPLGEHNNEDSVIYDNFDTQSGHQPEAHVSVSESETVGDKKTYTITSTGKIGLSSRTVTKEFAVTWKDKSTGGGGLPFVPLGASLISNSKVTLLNGYIYGDLYLDSKLVNTFEISNSGSVGFQNVYTSYEGAQIKNIYHGAGRETKTKGDRTHRNTVALPWNDYYDLVENFPGFSDLKYSSLPNEEIPHPDQSEEKFELYKNNNLILNEEFLNGFEYNIKSNMFVNKIEVLSDRTLNINTGGNDINIHVNELLVDSGRLNIIGGGSINFYVQNNFQLNAGSTMNSNGTKKQLTLYYSQSPGKKITFGGDTKFNGNLFVNKGIIEFTGSSSLTGSLLFGGNKMTLSGNSTNNLLIVAPKAEIEVTGSGENQGILIGEQIKLTGGSKIRYSDANLEDFPFGNTPGNGETGGREDIITTGPAIEK